MALAMYPNVLTVARRIAFLWALSNSSNSKQIRIHSRGETNSAPRSECDGFKEQRKIQLNAHGHLQYVPRDQYSFLAQFHDDSLIRVSGAAEDL